LDNYVQEDNPFQIVEAFVEELDLAALGFAGAVRGVEAAAQVDRVVRRNLNSNESK
jgi:hypothetical protein